MACLHCFFGRPRNTANNHTVPHLLLPGTHQNPEMREDSRFSDVQKVQQEAWLRKRAWEHLWACLGFPTPALLPHFWVVAHRAQEQGRLCYSAVPSLFREPLSAGLLDILVILSWLKMGLKFLNPLGTCANVTHVLPERRFSNHEFCLFHWTTRSELHFSICLVH